MSYFEFSGAKEGESRRFLSDMHNLHWCDCLMVFTTIKMNVWIQKLDDADLFQ